MNYLENGRKSVDADFRCSGGDVPGRAEGIRGKGGNWLRLMLYGLLLTFPIPRSLTIFSRQQTKIREVCDL